MSEYIEINVPAGMNLPNIRSYAAGLLPSTVEEDGCIINQFFCMADGDPESLCVVQTDASHFSLLPGPEFSPRLYRGQNRYFAKCLPTFLRPPLTKIKILTDILKKYEFFKLLCSHPIVKYLAEWKIADKGFKVDFEGLAAHYEFSTLKLDLTRSKDVAMFFALCEKEDLQSDEYKPIDGANREAVLYTVDLNKLFADNRQDFHVVGFQPLPRPDAQKAYCFNAGTQSDFNDFSFVTVERTKVDPKLAQHYFELFEGGRKLFPNDPIDLIAKEIRNSKQIDREVLETSFDRNLIPPDWPNINELKHFLGVHGYGITDKGLHLDSESQQKIVTKWNAQCPLNASRVKFRLVSESC